MGDNTRVSPLKNFVAGGAAGACLLLAGHPLDTIKTQPKASCAQYVLYTGTYDCFRKTVSKEVRLQTQPKASCAQYVLYTGTYDCFRKTVSKETGRTKRWCSFHYSEEEHLKLNDLKSKAQGLINNYLFKDDIPAYPQPEFHVSHLKHDTDRVGLEGIRRDNGFKDRGGPPSVPDLGPVLWWSLSVGPDEISAAETRLLEKTYPDRTEEQVQMQPSFLETFATSPAFSKTSRLGSYRFTFPVEELLTAYSEQVCSGAQPVMRVLRTDLFKQEVLYVVLVHSPANQQPFSRFPLLTDDPNAVCSFRDGSFIWRSQAMCETHGYELVQKPEGKQMEAKDLRGRPPFYVWDHVTIALHMEDQVLKFDGDRLRENLKFCSKESVQYNPDSQFDEHLQAERFVNALWPDHPSPLEEA